jgi:DNA-binding transcriptional LysR family regulator
MERRRPHGPMKLGALPTLQAVVRRGSFALAAEEIGLTPSAVSQQMRNLEEYFGQPLFDRSGRTVKPTPLAVEIVSKVQGTIADLEMLRDRSSRDLRGRLRFGATNTVQLSVLPRAVRLLQDRYPGLQLTLAAENASERLLDLLKSGDIDAAVVAKPETGVGRTILSQELVDQPFVLVYPRTYSGTITAKDIASGLPWIRYDLRLSGGKLASKFVREIASGLEPRFELMSTDAVMSMVSEGLGFSVIPRPRDALMQSYPVNVLRLDRQMRKRQIVLARRAADEDNRRVNALLECLRAAYSEGAGQ